MEKLKTDIQNALDNLNTLLGTLVMETDETETLDFLQDDPALTSEITGTGRSIAETLYLAFRLSHPARETDIRNTEIAIYRMELEGIMWLQDLILDADNVAGLAYLNGENGDSVKGLREKSENLKDWIREALWDRVQTQQYFIEESCKEAE